MSIISSSIRRRCQEIIRAAVMLNLEDAIYLDSQLDEMEDFVMERIERGRTRKPEDSHKDANIQEGEKWRVDWDGPSTVLVKSMNTNEIEIVRLDHQGKEIGGFMNTFIGAPSEVAPMFEGAEIVKGDDEEWVDIYKLHASEGMSNPKHVQRAIAKKWRYEADFHNMTGDWAWEDPETGIYIFATPFWNDTKGAMITVHPERDSEQEIGRTVVSYAGDGMRNYSDLKTWYEEEVMIEMDKLFMKHGHE
jgi:hypothetical protein